MKTRPIFFSGDMVRAILDGRKTQTRRVVKPQPVLDFPAAWRVQREAKVDHLGGCAAPWSGGTMLCDCGVVSEAWADEVRDAGRCPYGVPGDRLWVRETWRAIERGHPDGETIGTAGTEYRADDAWHPIENTEDAAERWLKVRRPEEQWPEMAEPKWRPPIHMPRWASRIRLEVTDVRVERVRAITEPDAAAEGCPQGRDVKPGKYSPRIYWFSELWDSIYAKDALGWDANPWVWVVEFKRVEDQPEPEVTS